MVEEGEAHPCSPTLPPRSEMEKVKQPTVTMQCKDCDYKAKTKGDFQRHRSCHDKKSDYQCRWCSFSVESLLPLSLHVDQCHVNKTRDEQSTLTSEKQVFL